MATLIFNGGHTLQGEVGKWRDIKRFLKQNVFPTFLTNPSQHYEITLLYVRQNCQMVAKRDENGYKLKDEKGAIVLSVKEEEEDQEKGLGPMFEEWIAEKEPGFTLLEDCIYRCAPQSEALPGNVLENNIQLRHKFTSKKWVNPILIELKDEELDNNMLFYLTNWATNDKIPVFHCSIPC